MKSSHVSVHNVKVVSTQQVVAQAFVHVWQNVYVYQIVPVYLRTIGLVHIANVWVFCRLHTSVTVEFTRTQGNNADRVQPTQACNRRSALSRSFQ
jgi:hypothetical protein